MVANLCEIVGADVNMVRKGIGSDARIGNRFLYAGIGYGGSCFPKDIKALIKTAKSNGYRMRILEAVEAVNEEQNPSCSQVGRLFQGDLKANGSLCGAWPSSRKPTICAKPLLWS